MDVDSNNKSGSDEQMMDILLVFDKEKKTINPAFPKHLTRGV